MTALDHQPLNPNFLSPLGYKFQVKKCQHVNFFCQEVTVPGFALQPVRQGTTMVNIHHPGDHIDFEPLVINFKVDEDLMNYMEIYNWIRQLGFPHNHSEYADLAAIPKISGLGLRSEISVIIMSSDRNPKWEVIFHDAFPVNLGPLPFTSKAPDVNFISTTASFVYTTFQISSINAEAGP